MQYTVWVVGFVGILVWVLAKIAPSIPPYTPMDIDWQNAPVVITPDWSVAATLGAAGHPAMAVGDLDTFTDWSDYPMLPTATLDLGARFAPNSEWIGQIAADGLIYDGFFGHPALVQQVPIWQYASVDKSTRAPIWQDYVDSTVQLGEMVGKQAQFLAYTQAVGQYLQQQGAVFRHKNPTIRRIAVVQFASANQLYYYTDKTPFAPALLQMGLQMVQLGDAPMWGSGMADISILVHLDAQTCLVVLAPVHPFLHKQLSKHMLWRNLGYADGTKCVKWIRPVWAFGELPSMVDFVDNLVAAPAYLVDGVSVL